VNLTDLLCSRAFNNKKFLQKNFIEILQLVYQNELFKDLLNYYLNEIEIILNSDKFISLEEPLLEFLLKQDDLKLKFGMI